MRALALLLAATAAATPLTWSRTTPNAKLSLELPPMVRHAPVLADRLYRGEIKALNDFAAQADDPKDGRPGEDAKFRGDRWEMQVTYAPGVETRRLISVTRTGYTDTHGAHPNHDDGGVVFDKATNKNLHPLDLLKPGADVKALNHALCAAALAAKRERNDAGWTAKDDPNFKCPTFAGVPGPDGKMLEGTAPPQIALTESSVPGKAAGLDFLYSPYDLGAYAEGGYVLTLPAAVLAPQLKPDYAPEFAGRPKPPKPDR